MDSDAVATPVEGMPDKAGAGAEPPSQEPSQALTQDEAPAAAKPPSRPVAVARAAEPYYKAIDDAAARLVRAFFLFGSAMFAAMILWFAWRQGFGACCSFGGPAEIGMFVVELLTLIILLSGLAGTFAWGCLVLAGAVNSLVIAGEEAAPEERFFLFWPMFRLIGKGRNKMWLAVFGLALAVTVMAASFVGIVGMLEVYGKVMAK